MSELANKGISAVKWGALSSVARFTLQILAQAIMARALGPEIYGIFGMGLVVLTFTNFFAEFGFGWSLVYRKDLTDEDIRFSFTCQLLTGGLATIALFLCANLVAAYFKEPRVADVVRWLSVTCLLSAATAPATNLLARNMRFRETGMVQVLSYFVGYIAVGIPLSLMHFGVTALIAAWMSQSVVRLVGTYLLARHPLRPLLLHPDARSILLSGGTVFVTNITNWLLNNIDRMTVGRMLSAHSMGLYTAGANLANTPNSLLLTALQPAFMAAGAKLTDDKERYRTAYRRVMSACIVIVPPVFATLAALSPNIVATLYGPKWVDTWPVLAILFCAMPAFVVWGVSTPILWNTGRPHYEALLQWPVLLVSAIALAAFGAQGTVTVAVICALTLLVRALVISYFASRAIGLKIWSLRAAFARGTALSTIAVAAALLTTRSLQALPNPVVLLLGAVAATAFTLALVLWRPAVLGDDGRVIVARFAPSLGRRLAARA